jgi:hypothetical protein
MYARKRAQATKRIKPKITNPETKLELMFFIVGIAN